MNRAIVIDSDRPASMALKNHYMQMWKLLSLQCELRLAYIPECRCVSIVIKDFQETHVVWLAP